MARAPTSRRGDEWYRQMSLPSVQIYVASYKAKVEPGLDSLPTYEQMCTIYSAQCAKGLHFHCDIKVRGHSDRSGR